MKRLLALMMAFLSVSLTGCIAAGLLLRKAADPYERIETLKDWAFQHDTGTGSYSAFFGLSDADGNPVSAAADVDLRIEDEKGNLLYSGTHSVTEDDFSTYSSEARGEEYLARIRIPEKEIKPGKTLNGTVYFRVYKEGRLEFGEVSCEALYCLPVQDVKVVTDPLPFEVAVNDYRGKVESVYQIESVTSVYQSEYMLTLELTVSALKKSGPSSSLEPVNYKVYDGEGYTAFTGTLFFQSVSAGEKCRETATLYDVVPGETYKIVFYPYK